MCCLFFFNDTATTEIYTLSLHDALPISIKPDMVFLWDEAWFGFAAFSPVYRQRTAMRTASCLRERYRNSEYRKRYQTLDRKSTRLNSSHANISYAVFCLKKKKKTNISTN